MANKIYIGNISSATTDNDLFSLFSLSGQVTSAKVAISIDQKKNAGYGYVTMSDEEDMKKAILKCNNSVLKGNKIRVVMAHSIDQDENYFSNQNRFRRYRKF
ncbi:RNA-binding protein [Candidatus Roizmanbacteria bacterium CG22_combo_CG10-13_8_21_14_all_35_9]|uniref:RNA-binding protein n=4 Tax=Candidatus Roizmaniibacteriota TaxID=1752723 RepID=A0A2M8F3F8_9BACT|nr:MAG: RNA-binding protein [Candidatus Roizmanbacteria bacterium CG23_combo_of_CG06-09_8_20_14_all_35_49]PIP62412.1 MAG: RNA-binding protein [Candidatus Roizmanbacteria bacterium CG22_combo_CG10-13_8_21_14_all_35_9]PIY71380.1 MAG: RNA-binding protein [Candidatus Roizmanbacteria bacterium CG_4_10_14_0_8_um_filter_35_28]PJC33818.1 MAG: RNA-binding protein [Candidatus Roizmanbacteria bacterium CG_4_9_14_0_2_um_filter_35_15]PJC82546.1 MAG: RNA-binding protein [Candidatus Roizmanbacteria bacterium 